MRFYETTLAEPLSASSTARAYHLALLTKGRIPDPPVYRLHDQDLAALNSRYHSAGKSLTGARDTIAVLPGETFPLGMGSYDVRLPGGRTSRGSSPCGCPGRSTRQIAHPPARRSASASGPTTKPPAQIPLPGQVAQSANLIRALRPALPNLEPSS
ncbi:hypothetical protein AB0L00_00370 [Actinoallomurus sp. NPDC052308]|uniref:hypothetical protein n=1 Tax=Actinoallomurus sp. NPDC052308 TaxID=3155530 RepID=UPI00343EDFD2